MQACRKNIREKVVLARIRIGHTAYSRSSLFSNKSLQKCPKFDSMITIKHIINDCKLYFKSRRAILGIGLDYSKIQKGEEEICGKVILFLK